MKKTLLIASALFVSYSFSGSEAAYALDEPDAFVDIATDNTVVISADILIYGAGATHAKTKEIRNEIVQVWNKTPDGNPWTYRDPKTGEEFTVKFDANVTLYNNLEHQSPNFIADKWNPSSRKNYFEMINDYYFRSYVFAGDEGKWSAKPYSDKTYAHEFGHVLGFTDRYHSSVDGYSESDAGWENNLMGSINNVEQRNIDALMGRIIFNYRLKKRAQNALKSLDINWPVDAGYHYRGSINITMPHL